MSRPKLVPFEYAARDKQGRAASGVIHAETESGARRRLIGRNLTPMSINKVEPKRSRWWGDPGKADPVAVSIFTRQFATLTDAGLPLLTTIGMLADLTPDPVLRAALTSVKTEISGGMSLTSAMRPHPGIFTPIYLNMVEAGEMGGSLPDVLTSVADYLEDAQELRDRVMGAMIYPVVVLAVAAAAVAAMLAFVVPVFTDLFASEGLTLPFATQILVAASNLTVRYWYALVIGTIAGLWGVRAMYRSQKGRRVIDRWSLRAPFVGSLLQKAAIARFSRAMSSMVTAGVILPDALRSSARISGNVAIEEAVMGARAAVNAGSDLNGTLADSPVIPLLLSQMVKVGEESGRLDQMLDKIADFYEAEVRRAIDAALKAIEPAMIVGLGLVLGGIVVAMYTPIFDLMTSLG